MRPRTRLCDEGSQCSIVCLSGALSFLVSAIARGGALERIAWSGCVLLLLLPCECCVLCFGLESSWCVWLDFDFTLTLVLLVLCR